MKENKETVSKRQRKVREKQEKTEFLDINTKLGWGEKGVKSETKVKINKKICFCLKVNLLRREGVQTPKTCTTRRLTKQQITYI